MAVGVGVGLKVGAGVGVGDPLGVGLAVGPGVPLGVGVGDGVGVTPLMVRAKFCVALGVTPLAAVMLME